jgi:uncharacterized membrane protein
MNTLLALWQVLPALDWLALVGFFATWVGYAWFAERHARQRPSVLGSSNRARERWMWQAAARDNRVFDGLVVQNLSASPSFFASTTILIIGGLLAVLSTTDKASEFVRDMPFAARTSLLVFDLKVVLLLAIFVFAFFRFTWSQRQYSFGALLVAAAPPHGELAADEARRHDFAQRAGRVMGLAAESFNDGLRAYYMAFAATAWFFSPWAMLAGSLGVVTVLFRREFRSEVLGVLNA